MDKLRIESYIDHTLLAPEAGVDDIKKLCAEARQYHFKSVCIQPCHVSLARKELEGSGVLVCTVIGFPLGVNASEVKAFECGKAVEDGADEVDMVLNVGAMRDGRYDFVMEDIKAVVKATGGRAAVKVIIEACLLTEEEKEKASLLTKEAGADFVKTSTGFSTGGATAKDVALIRKAVGPDMKIKAAGGIRTYEKALEMIQAGADRIGASAGIQIVEESKRQQS